MDGRSEEEDSVESLTANVGSCHQREISKLENISFIAPQHSPCSAHGYFFKDEVADMKYLCSTPSVLVF